MADIKVEPKRRMPWLLWLVGLIVILALILWWLLAAITRRAPGGAEVTPIPAATAPAAEPVPPTTPGP